MLLDIGASGAPPPIWNEIAPESIYIGLDPDLREIHEDKSSRFHRSVIFNEMVTAEKDRAETLFYLTKSPFCSTVLEPNPKATAPWLESNLFEVESHTTVRTTTIESILGRLDISGVDWVKLDTQGTDLRLINSIPPDMLSKVMAIDTEPGLIDIYQREDMFVDVHRDLTSNGFWLSGMHTGGFVRMRRGTLEAARKVNAKVDEPYLRSAIRKSPAYLEARYLRTLEWLAAKSMSSREYIVLWVFALTDNQLGFALDLGVEFERIFGETDASRGLKAETWRLINRAHRRHTLRTASQPIRRRIRSVLDRMLR
ncbi:MAG: FkbM family methyltransferase [Acidobacteriota bacterium]